MANKVENEVVESNVEVLGEAVASVDLIAQLKDPNSNFYCSIESDGTRKTNIMIYNAVNSADESLSEHIGEVLEITDVVAYPVQLADEVTGVITDALRTVLIDKAGKTYTATSQGVTNSLARIFSIVGEPSWAKEPLKIKAKQVKTRNGENKVTILELIG